MDWRYGSSDRVSAVQEEVLSSYSSPTPKKELFIIAQKLE
jgi:hypothetical protein